jgi:hypothetical protein
MNNSPKKSGKGSTLEVNSTQIGGELIQIRDRIEGIEAILAHANRDAIVELVRLVVEKYPQRKQLLRFCEEPKTLDEMQLELKLNSAQAVHNHLAPLKDNGLLQHESTTAPVSYVWSAIMRRLTKPSRAKLLA